MGKDQTTTPGTPCPTLYDKCVGSVTSDVNHNTEDAGDGAYGLSSLSEKTRISNRLQNFSKPIFYGMVKKRFKARVYSEKKVTRTTRKRCSLESSSVILQINEMRHCESWPLMVEQWSCNPKVVGSSPT